MRRVGRPDQPVPRSLARWYPLLVEPRVKVRRRRGFTRLSSKNQATIPAEVVEAASLRPGDELKVEADGPGRVTLCRTDQVLDEFLGDLSGVYPEGYLSELRAEWD